MDLINNFVGIVRIEAECADITELISALHRQEIELFHIVQLDSMRVKFSVSKKDLQSITALARRRGTKLSVLSYSGTGQLFKKFWTRPVIVLGVILLLVSTLYLPTRVLFVTVEGNSVIPDKMILEKAASCGITFGASRSQVRSEQMKNQLLESIPQLKWAGINTKGCTAIIYVTERSKEETVENTGMVSSIVAVCDGVIRDITVNTGNKVCSVGQAVQAGEVLISGYTDCGLSIRAERASGEVYATTTHQMRSVLPLITLRRGEKMRTEKKYSLIIGKNKINFNIGSSIFDSSCVKMYVEKYLTLPGGFQLPVALAIEEWQYFDSSATQVGACASDEALKQFSRRYLDSQMVAGTVQSEQCTLSQDDDLLILTGQYSCVEMIGREQQEEILQNYGKSD